jgi:serine/alanine adding enzyme
LQNISESRRRQIKKALNNGSSIIEPENIEQIKDFYNILFRLYRYKIRKPLPDLSFFENFYQQSRQGKLGIIRLIKYNDQIIGGILAPIFENKCIYEWYVCGLDKEFKDQHPSVLATWAGIDYAIQNNISSFDFMGVGKPEQEYGVRDFKARFGGELVNHGRLTRINNKSLYSIAEFGYNILAMLKRI